ncbi:MAG: hypothetical protein Q9174_006908, partial [Haloplaca sp. 1 TL-2023]
MVSADLRASLQEQLENAKQIFRGSVERCHPDAHEARRRALELEASAIEGEGGGFNCTLVEKLKFEHDGAIAVQAYMGYQAHVEDFHNSWVRELNSIDKDAVDAVKNQQAATQLVRELHRWRVLNKWLVSIEVADANQAANDEVSKIKLFENLSRARAVKEHGADKMIELLSRITDMDPPYP